MTSCYSKLDQALCDLIEAYGALEEELEEKVGGDEDAFAGAVVEALETSLESAIDEQDSTTTFAASMISAMLEALEQLDPSVFAEETEDELDYAINDVDYNDDEDDIDLDEDIDEEEEDS